ncbi:NAD(P)-dependent oxidoreductase [Exiguobacterium flavidum]|uniref:NAD(P)-dependent oxidoreductase n=1 Tax=Exiguobacterium flavidum TaxID=2184695 RepID=UPI000DF7BB12|nr:NAD(P)H-binding protein [Exiguobacterium flavidum]
MKIALLGATGRTGRELLNLLLAGGHHVTALVRTGGSLPANARLEEVVGDATDPSSIERTTEGADAVMSALGTDQQDVLTKATPLLIDAAKRYGIRRIITIGTAGILDSSTEPGRYRFESSESKRRSTTAAEDHLRAYLLLSSSGLDWTVICPTGLNEEEPIDDPLIEIDRFTRETNSIPRANVARLSYQALHENAYLGQRVAIASYR